MTIKIGITVKNDEGDIIRATKRDKVVIKTYAVDKDNVEPVETFKLPHEDLKGIHIEEFEDDNDE